MKKILIIILLISGTVAVGTYLYLRAVTANPSILQGPKPKSPPEITTALTITQAIKSNDTEALKNLLRQSPVNELYTLNEPLQIARADLLGVSRSHIESITPLQYAIWYANQDDPDYDAQKMVQFIVNDLKADINSGLYFSNGTHHYFISTLAFALGMPSYKKVNLEILKLLIDLGADIHEPVGLTTSGAVGKTNQAFLLLSFALWLTKDTKPADILLKAGLNINQRNNATTFTCLDEFLFRIIPKTPKEYWPDGSGAFAINFLIANGANVSYANFSFAKRKKLDPKIIGLLEKRLPWTFFWYTMYHSFFA
jgi:hypothetical protein